MICFAGQNDMQSFKKPFILALAMLMTVGAGCLKSNPQPNAPVNADKPVASDVRPQTQAEPIDPKVQFSMAQKNFHDAKSFKAKFTLPTTQGVVKGNLLYVKPDRFQGTMQIAGGDATDMVVVADNLYMRVGSQPWLDVSGSKVSKQTITDMRTAVGSNKVLDQGQLENLVIIANTWDQLKSCDLFTLRLKDSKPELPNISICVKNDFPFYLEIETPQGIMHVDYYDFNSVFLIERPM